MFFIRYYFVYLQSYCISSNLSDGSMQFQIHLFDIDIPGKMTFMESKTLTAGQSPTIVDTGLIVICMMHSSCLY